MCQKPRALLFYLCKFYLTVLSVNIALMSCVLEWADLQSKYQRVCLSQFEISSSNHKLIYVIQKEAYEINPDAIVAHGFVRPNCDEKVRKKNLTRLNIYKTD